MTGPDFYAASAQLVPVLLLAVMVQFRYATPFAHQLMDAEIKTVLLGRGRRGAIPEPVRGEEPGPPAGSRQRARIGLHTGRRPESMSADEYMRHVAGADVESTLGEYFYFERRKVQLQWWVVAPVAAAFVSMLASLIALTFPKPPGWLAIFVWPGIAALLGLFFVALTLTLTRTRDAAREAAWDHLAEIGAVEPPHPIRISRTPEEEAQWRESNGRKLAEMEARRRTLRRHLSGE